MSDLRNFYGSDNSGIKIVEPVERVEPVYGRFIPEAGIGDRVEPLGAFHRIEVEDTSSTGRIVGGLAIALLLGAATLYGYEVSSNSQAVKPVVTQTAANNPAPASAMAAPQPAQSADATQTAPASPAPSETLTAPATPSLVAPAAQPVKKAPARTTRSLARGESSTPSSSGVPERNAAVQPVQPVYPTAPASAQANNNQPVVTPAMPEAAPAVPDLTPAPAPDVQAAPDQAVQPAPDQSAQPAQ